MDAESAEHKGALDLHLSILPRVQLTVHTCLLRVGVVQNISFTDWKVCLWQSFSILRLYIRLEQFLSWQNNNIISC